MSESREDRLEQWMRTTFEKATAAPEHYSVFTELFLSVYEGVRTGEKIDTLEDPSAPLEADDPDSPTASSCVEEQSLEKLGYYLGKSAEGHSHEVALLYALDASPPWMGEDRDLQRVFGKINRSPMTDDLTSPAYAEAYRVCVYQGESEFYAHQCGMALMGNDFRLSAARASAATYEDAFHGCLKRGRSLLYASLYADEIIFYDHVAWAAAAYAWSYESQIRLGRSAKDADQYASIYLGYFETYSSGDEMEEGSGESEMTIVYAEAEMRWNGKPYKKDTYITQFVNCYYALDKKPEQPMIEWFAEVEAAADRRCST